MAAKIGEGSATPEEYAEVLVKRQQDRTDINAAQAELEKLDKEEPEDKEERVWMR